MTGLGLLFLRTSLQSWEENRTPLSWNFGRLITRDGLVLGVSDTLMMAVMFLCVPFVQALQHQWFSYYYVGITIQHIYQTMYLGVAIWWGYHRQWYWVQSGYLVLRESLRWQSGFLLTHSDFRRRLIEPDEGESIAQEGIFRLTPPLDALVYGP